MTLNTKKPRTWTVQVEYLVPVYKNVTVEASSMEEAIDKAYDDDDWEVATTAWDACSDTYPCWAEPGEDVGWSDRRLPRKIARDKTNLLRRYIGAPAKLA